VTPAPRLALVTGASAGIGFATSLALARAGLTVVAVARRAAALDELARLTSGRVEPVVADVATADGLGRVFDALGGRAISALLPAAGVFPRALLARLDAAAWREAFAVNVDARLAMVRALAPQLRGGRVLFVGSDAASRPRPGGGAYSITQAASEMLWRCLAAELGSEIAFLLAKPGLVATDMLDASLAAPEAEFPAREVYAAMRTRGVVIAPDTVARFFCWLLLEAPLSQVAGHVFDIRDATQHAHWLRGPLYLGAQTG
jgi:NAD(P)-dependent dehydrogenase (short-subunit alcohol dehydrogenase family)